jgi:hypothetical protein
VMALWPKGTSSRPDSTGLCSRCIGGLPDGRNCSSGGWPPGAVWICRRKAARLSTLSDLWDFRSSADTGRNFSSHASVLPLLRAGAEIER